MPILCRKFSESAKTEAQLKHLNRREGMDSQDESDTAEKTEQTGAKGISQQAARKLVRGITRDAQNTEWESL